MPNSITPKQYGTYGTGHSTPICDELKQSEAYRLLTPVERLVLGDFIRVYMRKSKWDKRLPEGGFAYTWEMCLEPVSERAFVSARRRIGVLGFLKVEGDNQVGACIRYSPSSAWRFYKPTPQEAHKLKHHAESKGKRLRQAKERRRNLRRLFLEKCACTEGGDATHPEGGDTEGRRHVGYAP